MKIQHLAVIFIIIIMPIIIVISEFINTQMSTINTKIEYNQRLLNATYDTIKAFQLNTMKSSLYSPEVRKKNLEASVNVFYNSLNSAFKFDGTTASSMKEYIPAIVFGMYDGYYIYSPFTNNLDNINIDNEHIYDNIDKEYKEGKNIYGLKPFVYYSCRYQKKPKDNENDVIITYSLDNYIQVEGYINGDYVKRSGYVIGGIEPTNDGGYKYDGIEFSASDTETLKEYVKIKNKECQYITIDGTKYYVDLDDDNPDNYSNLSNIPNGSNDLNIWAELYKGNIFYIDERGEAHIQVESSKNIELYVQYIKLIMDNNYAYRYYKDAYDFTNWLENKMKLNWIDNNHIVKNSTNYKIDDFQEVSDIFKTYDPKNDPNGIQPQYSNSAFNRHRADVIKSVITTNLSKAITGFKKYTKSDETFIMPKIKDTDWEYLQNNICIATFMQGIRIPGTGSNYNSYTVIPNNLNKEYVDENDICIILKKDPNDSNIDGIYTSPTDKTIDINNLNKMNCQPAFTKIDLQKRIDVSSGKYYLPHKYYESYTNKPGSRELESIATTDMYRYMKDLDKDKYEDLKRAYYTALGRERYGSYKADKEMRDGNIPE